MHMQNHWNSRVHRMREQNHEGTSEGHGHIHCLECDNDFMGYTYVKLVKLYAFNMCILLYINYTE